ncbi:hypothetical protein ACHAXR_012585 [Thalassiosira sp. AJA248-18]
MLPSFPSLRERNLRTLYGDTQISDYIDNDKSPKGSVDEKIRPLVDLINRHPEYVTLSSCSGRVALFDPAGTSTYDDSNVPISNGDDNERIAGESREEETNNVPPTQKRKGTKISGKGRGKWIFVTHDILPDLGQQIIQSLKTVGQERLDHHHHNNKAAVENNTCNNDDDEPPITFKHEPPLLHVAAASLEAGKKLLHLAKSVCAMRESGLVVTEQRVTVELRTTGTMLCLPLMVHQLMSTSSLEPSVSLVPSEEYLLALADMANERMVQNERLLGKLFATFKAELFDDNAISKNATSTATLTSCDEEGHVDNNNEYKVSLQSLPPLNLWKTAAVVIPGERINSEDNNVDILAFGGQGIGPNISMNGASNGKAPSCRRWDAVFRLARRDGVWLDHWETISIANAKTLTNNNNAVSSGYVNLDGSNESKFVTNAGVFQVQLSNSLGAREGHCACVLPPTQTTETSDSNLLHAVILFGGRTGGPQSPSNDLFLFVLQPKTQYSEELTMLGRPIDVRGTSPEPRFGHTMTNLHNRLGSSPLQHGEPLSVIAGGTGTTCSSLSSVYILSRMVDNESQMSHFIWNRLSDMPSPRTYHSTFIEEQSMFVFGGLSEANDPFGAFENMNDTCFKHSLFAEDTATAQSENDTITRINELPQLIGSSAATLELRSSILVLHVGGAKLSADSNLGSDDAHAALNILTFQADKVSQENELIRAQISSIKLADSSSSNTVDFGSCVHHCLVALPKQRDAAPGDEITSAVIVGGGVPSFSFGQSYARSYLVNISQVKYNKANTKPSQDHTKKRNTPKHRTTSSVQNPPSKTINGKPMTEVDVIYVAARHAKGFKNGLESLQFLDKRYKMVKVDKQRDCDDDKEEEERNLIAIPVTIQCIDEITGTDGTTTFNESSSLSVLEKIYPNYSCGVVIGIGKEMVPYSSSSMSKMKQRHR